MTLVRKSCRCFFGARLIFMTGLLSPATVPRIKEGNGSQFPVRHGKNQEPPLRDEWLWGISFRIPNAWVIRLYCGRSWGGVSHYDHQSFVDTPMIRGLINIVLLFVFAIAALVTLGGILAGDRSTSMIMIVVEVLCLFGLRQSKSHHQLSPKSQTRPEDPTTS